MKNNNRTYELFEKYLKNTFSPEELDELLLLLPYEDGEGLDKLLKQVWEMKRGERIAKDQVNWEGMLNRIKKNQTVAEPIPTHYPRLWYSYATAAVALLALAVGYYFWFSPKMPVSVQLVETIVPVVKQDTILLADGSRVILNAGSTLKYPKSFEGKIREVHLEGEGYFEVTSDPDKPFVVYAGGLKTTVIGTSFNINAYAGQSKAEVTVLTGKVAVENVQSGRSIALLPTEKLQYTHSDGEFRKIENVNIDQAVLWNTGRLAFEDAPLEDIVLQYYRRFGQKIFIEGDGPRKCRLSLVFDKESPEEILRIISALTNTQWKDENGDLILYGKGCPLIHN